MPQSCNPNDPTDPNCKAPPPKDCVDASGALFVGDHLQATTYSPRASAALHLEIPLFDHVWLDGNAGIALTAFRHGDPYQPAPNTGPSVPGDQVALPGEPFASYQLGVGIRIGAP